MESIISHTHDLLQQNIDKKTQATSQRFFKEKIKSFGVKVPTVNKISKELFPLIKSKSRSEIFDICERLWQTGYIEDTIVACRWSYFLHKQYEPDDFQIFEKWVAQYVDNWASCDTLCNHTIGTFLEIYPMYTPELKKWAKSKNRWCRRASAVSLIIPARKGKFLKEILEIAELLLMDKDDLVQKGYGWMLKSASQSHQNEIFEFVMDKKPVMPRTALRYAIEKLPGDLKKKAMKK